MMSVERADSFSSFVVLPRMPKSFQSKSIPQDSSESSKKTSVHDEIEEVESVYRALGRVERPVVESRFSRPVVAALLGFIAGAVGAFFIIGDVFGVATWLLGQEHARTAGGGRTVVYERKERVDVPWEEVNVRMYEDIAKQVHPIYKKKKGQSGDDSLGAIYTQDEAVGSSVSVTSDGWFVTVKNAVKDQKSSYVVVLSGTVRDIDTVVHDPASDLVFFRTKTDGVTPARFFKKTVTPGLLAIIATARQSGIIGSLGGVASANMRTTGAKDLYESSEQLRSLFLVDARTPSPGAGAFSLNGELLGVYDGVAGYISSARMATALPMVLKQQRVPLTILGITALDLSTVSFGSGIVQFPSFGYRIHSIQSNSPAQKAKLQVHDIITAIESERVGGSKSLFERIQEYPPETTVTFELLRGSETLKVPVLLGGVK